MLILTRKQLGTRIEKFFRTPSRRRSLISEVQDYTRPSVNSWGLASERHQHITISDWCLNYNRSVIYQAALLDTITPATYELLPESAVPAEQPATTRSATCFNLPQLVEPSAESNGTSHKIVDQVMKGIMSMEDISEDTRERLLRAKSLMDQQDWREVSTVEDVTTANLIIKASRLEAIDKLVSPDCGRLPDFCCFVSSILDFFKC